MLRQGHSEARRLIAGVRPPILDEEGIVAAIAHLANENRRKKGPAIEYLSEVEFERLPSILENAVYRIAQEALANACAHSRSQEGQSRFGAVRPAALHRGPRLGRRIPPGRRWRKPFWTGRNSRAGVQIEHSARKQIKTANSFLARSLRLDNPASSIPPSPVVARTRFPMA